MHTLIVSSIVAGAYLNGHPTWVGFLKVFGPLKLLGKVIMTQVMIVSCLVWLPQAWLGSGQVMQCLLTLEKGNCMILSWPEAKVYEQADCTVTLLDYAEIGKHQQDVW